MRGRSPQYCCHENGCRRPSKKSVCRVTEEDFVGMDACPSRAEAGRQVTANSRGNYGDAAKIDPRADFEGRGRDAAILPWGYRGKAEPSPKGKQQKAQSSCSDCTC